MRIAFVDLVFSWPPHGGADVDLYNTMRGLQAVGHEVKLFVSGYEKSWERGTFEPTEMPFPAERFDLTARTLTGPSIARRFRETVDAFKPDAVIVGDGFFLKPYVIDALAHYPIAARYYAYEIACMRDILHFKDGAPCPNNYLRTPNECRRCALTGMKDGIARWRFLTWTHEYLAGAAFMPGYHKRLTESLRRLDAVLVYNEIQKEHLAGVTDKVHVVPGGVDVADYTSDADDGRASNDRTIILMTGRVEDPLKGLTTLLEAGERLAKDRNDFEIWATHTDHRLNNDWFRAIGWHAHDSLKAIYRQADICVVPSIWEEPFGLVAVEAMASGVPVCASRVGGLQNIVQEGETGYLFNPEDSAGLANHLSVLLDSPDKRKTMGLAGRARVEQEFDWARIIDKHYPSILEGLVS